MTLERILSAAVNSMITGHHAPHCYSAWVQGRGHVNDGSSGFDRADYLRQLERSAESEIENMGYAQGYAEPSYTQPAKGVLLANWNRLPRDLGRLLEKAGYAIEWSDEWTVCDDCNKALRTQPDGYDWQPAYTIVDDCSIVCTACVDEAEADDDGNIAVG